MTINTGLHSDNILLCQHCGGKNIHCVKTKAKAEPSKKFYDNVKIKHTFQCDDCDGFMKIIRKFKN